MIKDILIELIRILKIPLILITLYILIGNMPIKKYAYDIMEFLNNSNISEIEIANNKLTLNKLKEKTIKEVELEVKNLLNLQDEYQKLIYLKDEYNRDISKNKDIQIKRDELLKTISNIKTGMKDLEKINKVIEKPESDFNMIYENFFSNNINTCNSINLSINEIKNILNIELDKNNLEQYTNKIYKVNKIIQAEPTCGVCSIYKVNINENTNIRIITIYKLGEGYEIEFRKLY